MSNITDKRRSIRLMCLCPRFNRCSAPVCPLDPNQDDRDYLKGEPICTLSKSKRYAIGQNTDLPHQGLTKREWAGKEHWQGMNETERNRRQAKLGGFWVNCSGNLKVSDQGQYGGTSNPDVPENARANEQKFKNEDACGK